MASSVLRVARFFGVTPTDLPLLGRAHALAMSPRIAVLDDDRHPLYLHPGRTMLILLRDVGVTDPVVLAAAAVTESEDPAFQVARSDVRAVLGDEVADLAGRIPMPDSERLMEDLITGDDRLRLVALAERLDHVRHAHMRDDVDDVWRRATHAQARDVYMPIAERTHPRLAQRYRSWCRAFARKLA